MAFNAYIVDGVRTAVGKNKGSLSRVHPADLGAAVVDALTERAKVPLESVDDVIVGCVGQIGAQGGNLGRSVVLSSKLPESVPGTTVDRQCGSGQQAIHFAAQAVMSGTNDVVIACGVEVMSLVPIGSNVRLGMQNDMGYPFNSKGMSARYPGAQFTQFNGAELVAKKFDISREDLDKFAVESHSRAAHAIEQGYFKSQIIPIKTETKDGKEITFDVDEGVRKGTTLSAVSKLKLLNPDGGRHTAATASQISDGAAALLVVNERALKKYNLKPRARIVSLALAGSDPVMMLSGPIPATRKALAQSGFKIDDIDLYEVNEAFGTVPLAWAKELKADPKKLNVNGGAQALGHPLGASGAKLMVQLLNELERRKLRYGLLAICEGGGTANATIIERVSGPVQSKL